MYRICLDYGHGGRDTGAVYKGRKESYDNLSIGIEIAKELRRHGVQVDETRTIDITMSLKDRIEFANKGDYDYFISFHRNAISPEKATGAETFICTSAYAKSKELAEKIQKTLVDAGFIDRGVKRADFQVLRETKAPAVLVEIGFIDNTKDNELFDSKREEIVKAIAKAILSQLGISYKEEKVTLEVTKKQTLYRVMAGSYSKKENAVLQVERLKKVGFDAVIIPYKA